MWYGPNRSAIGHSALKGTDARSFYWVMNNAAFTVRSSNFDWHPTVPAATYTEALAIAKSRGWEAHINAADGTLVACWSPLYGTRVYNRRLAQ